MMFLNFVRFLPKSDVLRINFSQKVLVSFANVAKRQSSSVILLRIVSPSPRGTQQVLHLLDPDMGVVFDPMG